MTKKPKVTIDGSKCCLAGFSSRACSWGTRGCIVYHPSEPAMTDTTREAVARADRKLALWFFRDLSDEQRSKLLALFGFPASETGTHGIQRRCLKRVLAALRPAQDAEGWRAALEEAAKIAESHRLGEQLIQYKMSQVDQVGVVSATIAKEIRALAASPEGK